MKKNRKNRVLQVWLLLAVFAFPIVFQSLHIHECCTVEKEDITEKRHISDDCDICHFVLPCFTNPVETEVKTLFTFITFCFFEYEETNLEYYQHHYYLRAPPAI